MKAQTHALREDLVRGLRWGGIVLLAALLGIALFRTLTSSPAAAGDPEPAVEPAPAPVAIEVGGTEEVAVPELVNPAARPTRPRVAPDKPAAPVPAPVPVEVPRSSFAAMPAPAPEPVTVEALPETVEVPPPPRMDLAPPPP